MRQIATRKYSDNEHIVCICSEAFLFIIDSQYNPILNKSIWINGFCFMNRMKVQVAWFRRKLFAKQSLPFKYNFNREIIQWP